MTAAEEPATRGSDAPARAATGLGIGAGAVVVRQDRLLLVRITYGWAQGRWLLPNGHQEPGESLADCAIRELREETGLEGVAGGIVAVRSLATQSGSDTFVALRVDAARGDPKPDGREVDDARFLSLPEIAALAAEGRVVRLHRVIAEHVLGEAAARHETMPALDRHGAPATSTVYLFPTQR